MTSAASPLRPGALGTQARAFEEEADESRAWSGENSPDDEGLVSTSPTGKMAPGSGRATVTPRDPADPFITHCPLEVALSESPSRGRGSVTNMAERSTDSRVPLFSGLGYRKRWGGAGEPSPFSLAPPSGDGSTPLDGARGAPGAWREQNPRGAPTQRSRPDPAQLR